LSASAVVVAISFAASERRHQQRNEEADGAQPRIDYIEESYGEVGGRDYPEVVAPLFLFRFHIDERINVFGDEVVRSLGYEVVRLLGFKVRFPKVIR
jgi:hypothetical protein